MSASTHPLTAAIRDLLEQNNPALLYENANKDSNVIPTQRDLLAGIAARYYACEYLLPENVVQAHQRGEIHYHDLDYAPYFPMFNCMLVDLQQMLSQGFRMGNAGIEPPKSIATATAVTAQIIAQVASHIYGGTTINRIDEILAPYVSMSREKHRAVAVQWHISDVEGYAHSRTEKECHDAFQALEYEVNTLHTANGQTPFVTLGFGLGTSEDARMIQKAILGNRLSGLGKHHKTAIFPKLVFAIRAGVNRKPGDVNYDIKQLALKCASQRIYPDILNYDKVVEVTGSFKTPMGCRSFLNRYEEQGKEIHDGRCNLGVVTLNLPRIALEAAGKESRFWSLLERRLLVARQALMTRIARLDKIPARVAPILYMEGACGIRLNADDPIGQLFRHGRASISLGFIGLHETLLALSDGSTHPYDSPEMRAKGLAIIARLREATQAWKRETGYAFSLYSTPSENLCDRFCRLDRAEFGEVAGITDKGYYTNSFHLDVEKKVDPYAKIDFEAPYTALSSGGFICYGEYPNLRHNLQALEDVWDYSYDRVPYYGTNTPIDECYECGFTGEFTCSDHGFSCPQCGNHNPASVSVTRRVCGYLGSPDARPFNSGKQQEVARRVKHLPEL
ncbi:anaerobic ribonucleoside-triphosphate reductase [Candidatus Pantoea multigeneris]|uniref:Anaerobic ribonucleoside-triphosphate reductase n=1 Tax=Candidatus Pantoea multigeneris TaxID=2608357 RepID=A0ABX0RB62_9GAMM|nr:anaerobic ribonucleoside-triphosphate reductase [Pantoea multigeneris]NIF22590.1 anaerobic ribonucleoside-triphosphate reductase [Pantoea multigeneris]